MIKLYLHCILVKKQKDFNYGMKYILLFDFSLQPNFGSTCTN